MTAVAALACLAAVLAGPQDPGAAPPAAEALLARFSRLAPDLRNTVVRNMERHLQRLDDDILQGILALERGMANYPARTEPTWLLPRDYAPVATERHLVASGTPLHARATARMTPLEFLPDLYAAVDYDWLLGKAARTGLDPDDGQRFANYVRGYPPGTDHAVARILELLDTDPAQRELGWYFEHLYADREGAVFAGVTLFDAWNSGLVVEMPDTDAIAYARRILGTRSFAAPIPGDRRRDRLYARVREGFVSHREYRSLRLAAAASFVAADPHLDATYEPLIRRCHWLWIQTGRDPEKFAARLGRSADRSDFLREVDAAIESAPEVVEGRRHAMRQIAEYLRALADRELTAVNG